jgi:hypothetical protein
MDIEQLLSDAIWRLTDPVFQPVQTWLEMHPLWNWLLIHPLWLLGLIVLVLFLFAGLMGAIARLTEALWLALLQAPIRLVQLLFVSVAKLLKLPFAPKLSPVPPSHPQERLTTILNRLEMLHQEQDELMQEVRSILSSPSPSNQLSITRISDSALPKGERS